MTSRFYTKPLVCISFDTTGSDVILGMAESVPHANPPGAGFTDALIAAVEKAHPSIQAYIRYRPHSPLIVMSRTAEKASGLTTAEMACSVRAIIDTIEQ